MYKIFLSIVSLIFVANISYAVEGRPSQDIKLTYKAYFGGFVISELFSVGHMDATDYQAEISYHVTGLGKIFSNMKNKVTVRGKFAPDGSLRPLVFENQGSWSRYSFSNRTEFQEDDSKIISHDYEFKFKEKVKYIPIKDELKYGPDMVSFFLGLTLSDEAMKIGAEVKHQNIFGGFFLMDIAYRCTENKQLTSKRSIYNGEVLVCNFKDKVIEGAFKRIKKKKKSKKKKNTDTMEPVPMQIWYAKLGDLDQMIPVYSEFPMGWGKVRVYLTNIEVTTN